jgi:hypothetical protein
MPMASVRAYTVYTTLAEKLEAVVVLGSANSRTKDYYDLSELPRALALDGSILAESIRRTFARRATVVPATPLEGLSDDFARARCKRTAGARSWTRAGCVSAKSTSSPSSRRSERSPSRSSTRFATGVPSNDAGRLEGRGDERAGDERAEVRAVPNCARHREP